MAGCEATVEIRTRFEVTFTRKCARPAYEEPVTVCGIHLCWQHREKVTRWEDGEERLSPNAHRWFEEWGVTPRGPFVPEDVIPLPD